MTLSLNAIARPFGPVPAFSGAQGGAVRLAASFVSAALVATAVGLMPMSAQAQEFGPSASSAPAAAGPATAARAAGPAEGLGGPDGARAPMRELMGPQAARGSVGTEVGELLRALDAALSSQDPVDAAAQIPTQPVSSGVLLELYTSQGCAACPPADVLLSALSERKDVFPLALHVDYWDYLGWKDPFAMPEFTARQKNYARARGSRTIYTPQMIVAGVDELTGPSAEQVETMISSAKAQLGQVQLRLGKSEAGFRVELSAQPALSQGAVVQIVRYIPEAQVEILRGENAGKVMDYANIVTAWHAVAEWDGVKPMAMNVALDGPEPAILIVQEAISGRKKALPGPIKAAIRLQ